MTLHLSACSLIRGLLLGSITREAVAGDLFVLECAEANSRDPNWVLQHVREELGNSSSTFSDEEICSAQDALNAILVAANAAGRVLYKRPGFILIVEDIRAFLAHHGFRLPTLPGPRIRTMEPLIRALEGRPLTGLNIGRVARVHEALLRAQ